MVWFARWRRNWKTVVMVTFLLSTLTREQLRIREMQSIPSNKMSSVVTILEKRYGNLVQSMTGYLELLKSAAEYKSLAEKYAKNGYHAEAIKNYKIALELFEKVYDKLPKTESDYDYIRLSILRNDPSDKSPEEVEKKLREIKVSVSKQMATIKTELATL